ncbi:hypothetical protein IU452_11625 [Nocardia transvalensis]|nr:hypothetical protein [Nocardia transvalensis]
MGLTACGGHDQSSTDANGLRKNPSATPTTTAAPTTTRTVIEPPSEAPTSAQNSALGPASQTTCAEFRKMDTDGEKALIEKILAENPGSKLDGNPSIALGTAKLVCLASSQADNPVAVAIGVAEK